VSVHDEIWAQVPAERHLNRVARDWALESVAGLQDPRVLDVGCGDGLLTGELAKAGVRVTGVDPSAVALERARAAHPGIAFAQTTDDGRLPFDDVAFDAAVCLNVLEHVADTQLLLSEVRRVLAPGGVFAVAVPFHGRFENVLVALGSFERHYDPLQPVLRFYTSKSLRLVLGSLGFEVLEQRARGGAPLVRETLLARAVRS